MQAGERNSKSMTGQNRHSPTVMDSGRPDVCSTLETGADCVGGLDSILKHMKKHKMKQVL